jgi:hypothetical protein
MFKSYVTLPPHPPPSSASSRLVTGRVIGNHKHRHKHPCASLAKSFIASAPMASLEEQKSALKSQRPGRFYMVQLTKAL